MVTSYSICRSGWQKRNWFCNGWRDYIIITPNFHHHIQPNQMETQALQHMKQNVKAYLAEMSVKNVLQAHKTSFLVFRQNKYITVPIEKIAFFTVKYESTVLVCFDRQEFFVNYSLDNIQHLV